MERFFCLCLLCVIFYFPLNEARSENANGWEIRTGLYAHELRISDRKNKEGGVDINAEILTPSFLPYYILEYFRARLGMSISLSNRTDLFYGGFVFELDDLIDPFFITLGLDMAVHTGRLRENDSGFKAMGCRWAFHVSASPGMSWRRHHRIMLTIEHASNADSVFKACPHNAGLTNAGIRYGYRF